MRNIKAFLFLLPFYLYEDIFFATAMFILSFFVLRYEKIINRIDGLDVKEFIFFTYLFHMLIGERSFAYVGVEPLFITEITIFVLCLFYIRDLVQVKKLLLPYYLLVVIGLFFAILYFPQNKISALRDSMMLVYAIWVPIIYYVFKDKKKYTLFFELLKPFIVVKTVHYLYLIILILLGLWFPTFEGFRFGVGYIVPSLVVVSLVLPLKEIDFKYKVLSLVMIMAVFTLFHRSIFLGILLAFAVYFFIGSWKTQKSLMRYGATGLFILVFFIIVYSSITGFDFIDYLSDKASLDEGNINYRFLSWGIVMEKFYENYLLGYGVGSPLFFVKGSIFYDTTTLSYFDVRDIGGNSQPHNSYINILTRFGIFIFPIFLWALVKPLRYVEKVLPIKNFSLPVYNRYLLFLGFLLVMYVIAFFNVALEGPHHSFPYWLAIALVLSYHKYAIKYPSYNLVKVIDKENK